MRAETLLVLDTAFRGGAILLLVQAAILLARAQPSRAARFGLVLMICGACAALDGLTALRLPTSVAFAAAVGSNLAVPMFWLCARAWFDDGFRPRPRDALATVAVAGLGFFLQTHPLSPTTDRVPNILLYAAGTAMAAHALWLAWRDRDSDLVEDRRQMRAIFVISVSLVIVWSLWSEAYVRMTGPSPLLGMVSAAVLALVALGMAAVLFRLRLDDAFPDAAPAPAAASATAAEPIDPDLARGLERLMEHECIYRSPELTIGLLAARLGAPEYRVRRLINGGLGHRNFNEYLNAKRLMDVRQALADRDQIEVPILTIAMDAGFGSLAAFNRAFKGAMGETPTDFRRRAVLAN